MKKILLITSLFLTVAFPVISFSAISVAVGIPIQMGPQGPLVYVHAKSFPTGSWEDVSLDGTIAGGSADHILVRTPEGVQHHVYLTAHTLLQGHLNRGASVSIEARLIHGALYATEIHATSYPNPNANAPSYSEKAFPPVTSESPMSQPATHLFQGTLVETTPNSVVVLTADGSRFWIRLDNQSQIYGPLTLGASVSILAYPLNGTWVTQSINIAYDNGYASPPTYVYPYPTYVYPDYVYPHIYIYGHWGWGWHDGHHHRH